MRGDIIDAPEQIRITDREGSNLVPEFCMKINENL